jgi:hypothetical protein
MLQEKKYEKEELGFITTKQRYLSNQSPIEQGETVFTNKETNTAIKISWKRYGKYLELDYWIQTIQ